MARSERVRYVLTHASRTRIYLNFSGVRVSNILMAVEKFTLIVNIN